MTDEDNDINIHLDARIPARNTEKNLFGMTEEKREEEETTRVTILTMKKPSYCDRCGSSFDTQVEKCTACGSDRIRELT